MDYKLVIFYRILTNLSGILLAFRCPVGDVFPQINTHVPFLCFFVNVSKKYELE